MANGGTIRKLENGKWQWVGYYKDAAGKIHRPTKSFNTQKAAEEYRDSEATSPKHIKNILNKTDYTVEEFYEIWKKETEWGTENKYKFTTTNNWLSIYRNHVLPFIGKEKLQNIDYSKLQEHFRKSNLSKKTYKNILHAIKSLLQYAKKINEDLIIVDNLAKVEIFAINKPKTKVFNLMTERDYTDLVQYMRGANLYYTNLIEFLHETGARIEEALALTWDDIDLNKKFFVITKAVKRKNVSEEDNGSNARTQLVLSEFVKTASSYRAVPLGEYACRALIAQKNLLDSKGIKSEFVFPSTTGKMGDSRNVLRSFHDSINRCNKNRTGYDLIPIRGLHSLRKMNCKYLRDVVGLDWELIARTLGHSEISVTKRYYYSISEEDTAHISELIDGADPRLKLEHRIKQSSGADVDGSVFVDGVEYDAGSVVFFEEDDKDF